MKILMHHEKRESDPERVKSYCDLDVTLLITIDDIEDNIRNINSLRGMALSTILIPKELGYYENQSMIIDKELEESYLWQTIRPRLYNKDVKIIFY